MMKPDLKFWQDRNIFITGCTGFLGSWLTEALIQAESNVTGLIRDHVHRSPLMENRIIDKINVVWGKVEDYQVLERALNEYEIETVFHLAAQTIVRIANRNALSTFETNIRGTWNLLEACRRVNTVKQVVVASSDKAYGEQENLPYDETFPLRGSHPYDVSKSCADLLTHAYFKTYGLPACITRCGNFYGGGDLNFNRIVPGTIRSILRNKVPVIRSDGTYTRDYIYIEDAAFANILLAEKMARNKSLHGEAFNFSCENPLSALELVNKILDLMGKRDLKPKILNEAMNEIPHQYLSAKKAKELLNWKPSFTLEEGLRKTIDWYKKFFGIK
jgi:CDP-glucose 4,6-dehydratase